MKTFTLIHVAISLVGIVTGFAVMLGLLTSKRLDGWTALFLVFTVATSVTGFFFPFHGFTPGIGLGIISLVLLALAILARYARQLVGNWRWVYVLTAVVSQYLNFFVLIAQSFQKVPALKALAPTQTEPPFLVAQLLGLALFILIGIVAVIKFRVEPADRQVSRVARTA